MLQSILENFRRSILKIQRESSNQSSCWKIKLIRKGEDAYLLCFQDHVIFGPMSSQIALVDPVLNNIVRRILLASTMQVPVKLYKHANASNSGA